MIADAAGIFCMVLTGGYHVYRRKWHYVAVALVGVAAFALDLAGIGGPRL